MAALGEDFPTFQYPGVSPEEQVIIDQFYGNEFLGDLHGSFLYYAARQLDAMPRPRFGQHDPLPAFGYDDFVARFGIDTSHRLHPIRQHHVLGKLISHDYTHLDATKVESLELTAVVHDMGEPFCQEGDTIFGTRRDPEAETNARHAVLRDMTPRHAEEIIDRTEPNLASRETEGGWIFYISELIGYCLTGKKVAVEYLEARKHNSMTPDQLTVAGVIATDVFHRTLHKLRDVGDESAFAYVTFLGTRDEMQRAEEALAADQPDIYEAAVAKATGKS